jgi:hypothetical protein
MLLTAVAILWSNGGVKLLEFGALGVRFFRISRNRNFLKNLFSLAFRFQNKLIIIIIIIIFFSRLFRMN